MSECWFCREPVEDAPDEAPVPIVHGAATTATIPISAPIVAERPTRPPIAYSAPRARGFSFWRAVRRGIVYGLLVALGLVALEMAFPRFRTTSSGSAVIEDRHFSDRGFAVAVPAGWEMRTSERTASFLSPERTFGRATRGFRVSRYATSFKKVPAALEANRGRVTGYRSIFRERTTLAGEDAVLAVFAGNGLRFEQWWVAAGKGMYRIELWSRLADDDAIGLNRRIVGSFELL